MRQTLVKAFRLPGQPVRRSGVVVEVDDALGAQLKERGIAVDETVTPKPSAPTETHTDTTKKQAPEPAADEKRPAKSASAEAWQEYAKAQGLDPKGLSKQELIAALS